VLSTATDGMHDVLVETTKQLQLSADTSSLDHNESIATLVDESLHVNPLLRRKLSNLVRLRRDKIQLSMLVKDESDLRAGDDAWDPEHSASSLSSPLSNGVVVPKFSPQWAERALKLAADRVEAFAEDNVRNSRMGDVDENPDMRILRFNLLALARFVPLAEGIQLS